MNLSPEIIQETQLRQAGLPALSEEQLSLRLSAFREGLAEKQIDCALITSRENSRYLANFTGDTSIILITAERAAIYVDSRFTVQAGEETSGFEVIETASIIKEAVLAGAETKAGHRGPGAKLAIGLEEANVTWETLKLIETVLTRNASSYQFEEISGLLAFQRRQKDSYELAMITEAVDIADLAWTATLPVLKAGVSEAYVAAVLEHNMRLLGASGPSFDTIIASGYRAAMPHGVASGKLIEAGDTIVMDFGAIYNGYCSDITRTVFVGEPDEEMLKVYEIVLQANLACEASLKAGLTGRESDKLARDVIDDAGYGETFGHSTGHSLGLEIHENPRSAVSWDEPLAAGVLMTVEPGIYLEGKGGVRIEDTVVIREDGIEILTRSDKSLKILPA